jgi:hypothetical protein
MTSDDEERLIELSGRLSYDAWVTLQEVRQHPQFADVMSELEKVEGSLSVTDVQRALRRFVS